MAPQARKSVPHRLGRNGAGRGHAGGAGEGPPAIGGLLLRCAGNGLLHLVGGLLHLPRESLLLGLEILLQLSLIHI